MSALIATGHDDTSFADFARLQREHWHPDNVTGRTLAALATLSLFALFLIAGHIAARIWPPPIVYTMTIVTIAP